MSTYEAAYKSLLQGVSQQIPEERLPGQLTAQTNMLSDPVTNLRRRPGLKYRKSWAWASVADSTVISWFTDIAGSRVHILLNTATGNIRVLNENYVEEANLSAGAYLTAASRARIRAATVGNELVLCNLDKVPAVQYAGTEIDPQKAGFFYLVSGAFGKEFNVSVVHSAGTATVTYTTPGGTGAGDAALSTPEYIATQLANALTSLGLFTVTREGPYVFITDATVMRMSTSTGKNYLITSNNGYVSNTGDLPARLPTAGDTYTCRVGDSLSGQYYRYVAADVEWEESGAYGSPSSITNTPISLIWNGTAWALDTTAFQGRGAGDSGSNPLHEWMSSGITGMASHQGRLVILSGPMVSMSAAGNPRQFFRSTVTSVVNSDALEIGSSMNSAAAYEWAVPFQRDLVLFSSAYQAVIPSGNVAISPATAVVVPTSTYDTDTTSSPVMMGRTVMYCTPKSEDFFGAMEMVPSTYSDSQYMSQDATPHLPKYMGGRCRFAVSSSVANIALFGPSGDPYTLIVHEYFWNGEDKVQQAWHQWTFEYPVEYAHFAGDMIILTFVKNGNIVMMSIDPRAGAVDADGNLRPFLDGGGVATIVANEVTIPAWMLAFDPLIASRLKLAVLTGPLAGELVGAVPDVTGTKLITVASYPSGTVGVGVPYYSGFIPTPPIVRDYKDEVIHTGKATVSRFIVGTRNSSEFTVNVSDTYSAGEDIVVPTLTFTSPELDLGRALFSEESQNVVPCRTDLRSTSMEVFTEATGELNITSLEYVAKYHPKIKRR